MRYDAVIIGAGPAGLSAARVLEEGGKSVLLLNDGRRDKCCAGGLSYKVLDHCDIPPSIIERGFSSLTIHINGKKKTYMFPRTVLATVSRKNLSEWQIGKLKKTRLIDNVKKIDIRSDSVLADGKAYAFSYLVGAEGAHSLVRKKIGLPSGRFIKAINCFVDAPFKDVELFFSRKNPQGYLWIFPHKGRTSIGCGGFNVEFPKLRKMLDRFLLKRGLSGKLSAGLINFDFRGYRFGNKFLVGEASGLASPLTGEGIYFAIVSGEEIAKEILNPEYHSAVMAQIGKKMRRDYLMLRAVNILSRLGFMGVLEYLLDRKNREKRITMMR